MLEPFSGCGTQGAQCVTFSDVWQWSPGTQTSPLRPGQCTTPACGWEQVIVNGASPPARFSHASGILADKLFIYGGIDANGVVLQDFWAFSRTDKAWAPVALSGAALPLQVGPPAGAFLGSIFYLSLTTPQGAALFRIKPCFDCAAPAPASSSSSSAGLIAGLLVGGGAALAAVGAFVIYYRPHWIPNSMARWASGSAPRAEGAFFTSLG